MKTMAAFLVGGLAVGGSGAAVGYAWGGADAVLPAAAGFALAFLPAAVTLAWVTWTYRSTPEMQLLASLGGSGVRMAVALTGGYFLTSGDLPVFEMSFWYWILFFYLVLLALEIGLLVRQQPNAAGAPLP